VKLLQLDQMEMSVSFLTDALTVHSPALRRRTNLKSLQNDICNSLTRHDVSTYVVAVSMQSVFKRRKDVRDLPTTAAVGLGSKRQRGGIFTVMGTKHP
jgi:hypothetical protein